MKMKRNINIDLAVLPSYNTSLLNTTLILRLYYYLKETNLNDLLKSNHYSFVCTSHNES